MIFYYHNVYNSAWLNLGPLFFLSFFFLSFLELSSCLLFSFFKFWNKKRKNLFDVFIILVSIFKLLKTIYFCVNSGKILIYMYLFLLKISVWINIVWIFWDKPQLLCHLYLNKKQNNKLRIIKGSFKRLSLRRGGTLHCQWEIISKYNKDNLYTGGSAHWSGFWGGLK